eukprot:gene30778-35817_t
MSSSEPSAKAQDLKAEANAEFGKENYLKAAALYSKAIKQDPESAVLFSNRSAALLKLKKVGKALEDAEECIKLRPEWEKGYFRKGAILEDQQQYDEALKVYQKALELNADSKDLNVKIRNVTRLMDNKAKGILPKEKKAKPTEDPTKASGFKFKEQKSDGVEPSAAQPEAPPQEDLGSEKVATFCSEYLQEVALELRDNGTTFTPMVHFLPGPNTASHEEQELHVRGVGAFDTPETLHGFIDYLRQQSTKLDAAAVFAVMPKPSIATPQLDSKQLDSTLQRKCWWIPLDEDGKPGVSCSIDADAFGPLPVMLRT